MARFHGVGRDAGVASPGRVLLRRLLSSTSTFKFRGVGPRPYRDQGGTVTAGGQGNSMIKIASGTGPVPPANGVTVLVTVTVIDWDGPLTRTWIVRVGLVVWAGTGQGRDPSNWQKSYQARDAATGIPSH